MVSPGFSDEGMKRDGVGIVARCLPGRKISGEMILVVGTYEPVPFPQDGEAFRGPGNVCNLRTAWLEFQRWLAPIPLSRRAEGSAVYQIVPRP